MISLTDLVLARTEMIQALKDWKEMKYTVEKIAIENSIEPSTATDHLYNEFIEAATRYNLMYKKYTDYNLYMESKEEKINE